jgi:putative tryptophan/tyrosine transport system substrate-binding protein
MIWSSPLHDLRREGHVASHIGRRKLLAALGGVAAAWSLPAWAQKDRARRVAIVMPGAESDQQQQATASVFRDGLRKLGWIDGQNVRIEVMWGAAPPERARAYVAELIASPPEVVVCGTLQAFLAMRRDGNSIPMVFFNLPDPVVMGIVPNLAKPEGNFTGFTAYDFAIAGKWLEVLKELAPQVLRVAMILGNSTQPVGEYFYRSLQAAAGSFGVETTAIRIDTAADVKAGIDAFALKPNGGLVLAADAGGFANRALVVELAARHHLPAIYPMRNAIEDGGLAFYGIDFLDLPRGAATYVNRILRGAMPADLPVQAPTKFELIINLKTAKALGLEVPLHLQQIADEVIE